MTKMIDEIEHYLQEVAPTSSEKQGTNAVFLPTVSVVIPTYNRKDMLRETLNSLAQQTYPTDRFEIIVVDDGSTDGTDQIAAVAFPFTLRYFWQTNQGDATARNLGARQSQADILVFLDDDILVEPDYLTYLIREHDLCQSRIVVGTVNIRPEETTPLSHTLNASLASKHNSVELAFTDVYSNNMALRREAYFEVGMMQDLGFPGSSIWCDIDLAYRAYQQGFDFRRSTQARCWHRDYFASSMDRYKQRIRTAAYRAVVLFQKYPELPPHLHMFSDKTPISWGQDPPRLIVRKLVRSMASSRPAMWGMEQLVSALEKRYPASRILPSLYRYIIGGNIFQGYREGLRKFGQVDHKGEIPRKRIEPSQGWVSLQLGRLWEYRGLLYFFAWRDIKVRYKQTIMGASWAIIQPLITMVIFSLFFGRLARVPSDGLPYPIFSYAALVPWTFFANALTQASNSLIASANMLKKIYFPRLTIPVATVLAGLVDFVLAFSVLLVMIAFYGLVPTINVLWLPLFFLLALFTSLGVGLWLSAMNVQFRDVRYVIPFLTQAWLFATPIAYPSSLLPEPWRTLYALNPMVGVVEGFRWALLGTDAAPGPMIGVSSLMALALLVSGAFYFRRMEQTFADVV